MQSSSLTDECMSSLFKCSLVGSYLTDRSEDSALNVPSRFRELQLLMTKNFRETPRGTDFPEKLRDFPTTLSSQNFLIFAFAFLITLGLGSLLPCFVVNQDLSFQRYAATSTSQISPSSLDCQLSHPSPAVPSLKLCSPGWAA